MDKIIIQIQDASNQMEGLKPHYKDLLITKSAKRLFLALLILSVCFIIAGLLADYDVQSTRIEEGQTVITYYKNGFHLALGVGASVFTLLFGTMMFKTREKVLVNLQDRAARYLQNDNTLRYELTEEGLSTESHEIRSFIRWSFFRTFIIRGDYIFLYSKTSELRIPDVFIPLSSLSKDEKTEVIDFLETIS